MQPADAPRLFLAGADLLGLCQEAFARGEVVRMPIEGVSMSPWLLPGDILRIEPATVADLRVGQVALYERLDRVIIHQLAARRRAGRDWLAVMRVASNNTLEPPLRGEHVLGRVMSFERDGEVRELDRLPLDRTSRMKAAWVLFLYGRVGEGSWVRAIPRRLLAGPRWLLGAGVALTSRLRRAPVVGPLVRWLWPSLHGRLRTLRLVRRISPDDESYVLEGYFARRKVGRAHLAHMLRPIGWESWWVGIEVDALYRRRGAAARLVEDLAAWAGELGIGPVYAAIRDDNVASLTLFQRLGWTRTDDAEMERLASEYYTQSTGSPWTVRIFVPPDA